ncbi:DEAD/DEAH box helicase [Candidatus Micrarchaeota archaeon]|nr:DEAD/DEAH box helicase [Candidatus Micrarchaeota archaeon]
MKFVELKLSEKSLRSIKNYGYEETTEVQKRTIPKIMEGRDLIVRSQTGTGKTAAFSIGLMERIAAGKLCKAIVLVPTRELAVQVTKEMNGLCQVHQLRIYAVYGGTPITKQMRELKKHYDVLVATPGRLLDLVRRDKMDMSQFNAIVLDEADHMLDMGFQNDVLSILDMMPAERQSLLFSATIDEGIKKISLRYMPDAELITIGEMAPVSTVHEQKIEVQFSERFSKLRDILNLHNGMKILVFARTKRGVMGLKRRLEKSGFNEVGMLQGDMPQPRRLKVLNQYREGGLSILVATNVAARGLHIDDVNLIVNYDEAEDKETHLHRIGRTGRMGREGKVINLLCADGPKPQGRHRCGPRNVHSRQHNRHSGR